MASSFNAIGINICMYELNGPYPLLTSWRIICGLIWVVTFGMDAGHQIYSPDAVHQNVDQRFLKRALQRLQKLTQLLQTAQRAIYRVRYIELSSKEAKMRRDTVIALRRKRTGISSRTLFASWNIPYCRPATPKRKMRSITLWQWFLPLLNRHFLRNLGLGPNLCALWQHLSMLL